MYFYFFIFLKKKKKNMAIIRKDLFERKTFQFEFFFGYLTTGDTSP
jgi:hypothetical protein